tara:strand:+ start:361 stop:477 length:117 start_codon:yes stop_codon:yes gene_type:complete
MQHKNVERFAICDEFVDIMPSEYQTLVEDSTFGKVDRG